MGAQFCRGECWEWGGDVMTESTPAERAESAAKIAQNAAAEAERAAEEARAAAELAGGRDQSSSAGFPDVDTSSGRGAQSGGPT
jgi:hypothetical protein